MTTQATIGTVGNVVLGGDSSCKVDWVHEQICRAPLSANGTSIVMTQYVGAGFDAAVTRCASYVASAAPSDSIGLTSYESFCSSKKYPVSASSWTTPTTTASSSPSSSSAPEATNAAVMNPGGAVLAMALPVIGVLMAVFG
jgi:hypothetical protein